MADPINIGNPQAMTERTQESNEEAVAAAVQPAVVPVVAPNPSAIKAPNVAEVVAPVAQESSPVVSNLPVVLSDGRQVPLSEVTAGYEAAVKLGLDDKDTHEFISTVALAARGDEAALQRISELANTMAPSTGITPVANSPQAADGAPSVATPPVAPVQASPPKVDTQSITNALDNMLRPLIDRVNRMEPFVQSEIQTNQIKALVDTFKSRSSEFPRLLSGGEPAARRLLEQWNGRTEAAKRAKGASLNQHDLHQMLASEERYLAGAMPPVAQPAQIVSTEDSMATIKGKPVPNLIHGDPSLRIPQPPQEPLAPQAISTAMPLTGTPSPVPIAPQETENPTTQKGLRAKIDAQLAASGIDTRRRS